MEYSIGREFLKYTVKGTVINTLILPIIYNFKLMFKMPSMYMYVHMIER